MFETIYISIGSAVVGGGVVAFFLQSAKDAKLRKLRRVNDDLKDLAVGDESVEAAKRKAEEDALEASIKANAAKL